MNGTTEIIMQFGGLGALAVFFFFTLRWLLMSMDKMKECHNKATQGFIESANNFSQVMANHIDHSTEATQELTKVIEDLRRELE